MARNIALYPWFKFLQNLLFWQAVWFLFFQSRLSAAEAVLLYAIYDVGTTLLEVPSGYMSDRLGRRVTLILSCLAGAIGATLVALGDTFAVFAVAQVLMGASAAFASGTDNALLYESLAAEGRADEVEAQETRGWQFSLTALALSALTGGLIAKASFAMAFGAGALALAGATVIALAFREPPRRVTEGLGVARQWDLLRQALSIPVLLWLFALSVLMYGFSHLPFVFGQPFIAEALAKTGLQAEAPLVSGSVSAMMMVVSVIASLYALRLRRRLGLPALLMVAFGMQIALIAVLALTESPAAIAVLFLRMVPNSLSRPFIIARIQPLLTDQGRATFLSVQSLGGRLLLAGSLLIVSAHVPEGVAMAHADIARALGWYVLAGVAAFALLLLTLRRAGIDPAATAGSRNP